MYVYVSIRAAGAVGRVCRGHVGAGARAATERQAREPGVLDGRVHVRDLLCHGGRDLLRRPSVHA